MADNEDNISLLLPSRSSVADETPLSREPSLTDVNREQPRLSGRQEETAETLQLHDDHVSESIESFFYEGNITSESSLGSYLSKSELNRRDSRSYEASIHRKLGRWISFTVTLSLVTLCFALVVVSWIWLDQKSGRWHALILSTFSTRIVTLTAIGIRVAISSLAATATSMIASIALERRGVPMEQAAQVSIARFSNTGPESFFMLILASDSMEWLLRLSTALLIITSLASQFTSTLLLSDMNSEQVVSFAENMTVQYDSPIKLGTNTYNDPTQFENFAEYSEDVTQSDGVDDTGIVLRAFLPIAQQETRQSLHKFEGLSYVYDARVLCVRPEFEEVRLCYPDTDTGEFSRICGFIKPEQGLLDGPNGVSKLPRMEFGCRLTFDTESPWQLCWLNQHGMIPINDVLYPLSHEERSKFVDNTGNAYLLWDINKNESPVACYDEPTYTKRVRCQNGTMDLWPFNKSGPWLHAIAAPANGTNLAKTATVRQRADMGVKASLCFDSVSLSTENNFIPIVATGESNQTEPEMLWEMENIKYNTTALRQQLGATKTDIKKDRRGVFAITQTSVLAALASIYSKPIKNGRKGSINWVATINNVVSENTIFCAECIDTNTIGLGSGAPISAVFNDTITETNSPAKALQAYNTVLMRETYYGNLMRLKETTSVRITQYKAALVPCSCRGYLTVIGVVFVHIILFFIVAAIFTRTRSSLLGNTWLALAQLASSPDARDVFKHAAMATDKDVEKWIRSNGTPTSVIPRATTYQNIKTWVRRLIRPRTWNIKRVFRRAFWRRREGKAPVRRYVVRDGIFVPSQDQGDKVSV